MGGETLAKLYSSNKFAKIFLDSLSELEKSPKGGFTTLEHALSTIAEVDGSATKAEVRQVLEAIAETGCGRFLIGRRGHATRIVWEANAISVGKVARGDADEVEEATAPELDLEDEVEQRPGPLEDVRYPLRVGLEVLLRLPNDLTRHEAGRLARFIETLPKEGDG